MKLETKNLLTKWETKKKNWSWMTKRKISQPGKGQKKKTDKKDGHQMPIRGGSTRSHNPTGFKFCFIWLGKENQASQK